jgi:hypothetical protein
MWSATALGRKRNIQIGALLSVLGGALQGGAQNLEYVLTKKSALMQIGADMKLNTGCFKQVGSSPGSVSVSSSQYVPCTCPNWPLLRSEDGL